MMENGTRIFLAELINASIYNKTISEVPTGISAERIYMIAQRQGMIYLLLNPLLAANNVPEEIKNRIRKVIVWDTLTSKVQMHAIDTLGELFEKNGIRHQMLKGAVLKKIYQTNFPPPFFLICFISFVYKRICLNLARV